MSANKLAGIAAIFVLLSAIVPNLLFAQEAGLEELFKNMPPQAGASVETASEGSGPMKTSAVASGNNGGAASTSISLNAWSLSGEQTTTYHLPLFREPMDYSGIYLKPSVENAFRIDGKLGGVKLVSNWRVDIWPLGTPLGAGDGKVLSAGPADVTLTPEDNYIEVGTDSLFLQVGYLVDSWGTADGVNPTNNVNPVDYTQGLSPESIPSFLFRVVSFPIPSLSLEGVFEPYKRGDVFPVNPAASIPASLFPASEVSGSQPAGDLSSSVYGFKASLYTSAVDLSVSYLYDVDPYYTPEITFVDYQDKSLDLVRKRIHRIGADAKEL